MKKLFLLFLLLPVTSQTTEKKAELIVSKNQGINGLGNPVIHFMQGNLSVSHLPNSNEYWGMTTSSHGKRLKQIDLRNPQGIYLALESLYNAQQKAAEEKKV